jgi:hypothetical protein
VFENRVLRRIFGPKRDKVTRGWRKLHNEELSNLYFSPNTVGVYNREGGTRWRSWLKHCATSQNVVGSISDGVTGIFH